MSYDKSEQLKGKGVQWKSEANKEIGKRQDWTFEKKKTRKKGSTPLTSFSQDLVAFPKDLCYEIF